MNGRWKIDAKSHDIYNPSRAWFELSITHESWPKALAVRLQTSNSYKASYYGVCRVTNEHVNPEVEANIFRIMNENISSGRPCDKWWLWHINNGNKKFYNWSKEEALVSMRQVVKEEPPAEILDFFYNELVPIVENLHSYLADLSAPIQ